MTERAKQRIQAIRENQEARNKYRGAILALHELHIFDILREQVVENMESYFDNRDAMQYQVLLGYKRCISDLETLVEIPQEATALPLDFGARESLKEQGYTDAEIVKMLGEE